MENWQFFVLVALLVWILWRTRVVASTSPWLRDALLRRVFGQLNSILSAVMTQVPSSLINHEAEEENWWRAEIRSNAGKNWWERRQCGPWCHSDWHTPGISHLDEVEYERTHPHQESEESKREMFERRKQDADAGFGSDFEVGRSYELGWGVAKDWNEALRRYRKAAEDGDQNARFRLASAYFDGDGVPRDYAEAYFWFKLKEMDSRVNAVGDHLSPEQRAEVEQRCREWIQSRNS